MQALQSLINCRDIGSRTVKDSEPVRLLYRKVTEESESLKELRVCNTITAL